MIPVVVSPYSFRGSVVRFEKLVKRLKEIGMRSVILADLNFHGAVLFNTTMRRDGLVPVHGLAVGRKILVAKNREGYEELVRFHNGERVRFSNVVSLNPKNVKFVMYLDREDRIAYEYMKRMLNLEPLDGDFSLDGDLKDPLDVLDFSAYDLKVEQVLRSPPEDWVKPEEFEGERRKRLERELEMVRKLGFEGYFHAVERVVKKARSLGITVGPGRGSAVGSLLLHVLGISQIDPIEYGLLFERFLNPGRKEPPDVDIDVEDEKRKDLIESLKEEFGFVSLVSTFTTLKEKLLEREMRRLGFDEDTAEKLHGLPVRRSVHAAAVVLSDSYLNIPLIAGEIPISEYDMDSLKEVGVEKIDVLGLRTLTLLENLSKRTGADYRGFSFESGVFEEISSGLTTGIFQLESREARKIARYVRPENITELSHLLSLNRPGPLKANLHVEYLRRKALEHEIHPDLEDVLSETRGIFLYQEQIMLAISRLSGMTLEEADDIRRAISKKDPVLMKEALERVEEGMRERYDGDFVEKTLDLFEKFSSYAFNKSHSVAYAHISYWVSHYKSRYFPDFLLTLLSLNPSDRERTKRLVHEAFLRGYEVEFDVGYPEGGFEGNTIFLPLFIVPGLGKNAIEKIRGERISDVRGVQPKVVEEMIKVGAFDRVYGSRWEALKALRKGEKISVVERLKMKMGVISESGKVESKDDRVRMEWEVLGFSLTKIPFDSILPRISESISREMALPSHVLVEGGVMTDGRTSIVTDLPAGEYFVVLEDDGTVIEREKFSSGIEIIYGVDLEVPPEVVSEKGLDFETVSTTLGELGSSRAAVDSRVIFRS